MYYGAGHAYTCIIGTGYLNIGYLRYNKTGRTRCPRYPDIGSGNNTRTSSRIGLGVGPTGPYIPVPRTYASRTLYTRTLPTRRRCQSTLPDGHMALYGPPGAIWPYMVLQGAIWPCRGPSRRPYGPVEVHLGGHMRLYGPIWSPERLYMALYGPSW